MCGANNINLTVTVNMSFYILTVLYLYWFHVNVSFTDPPSPEGKLPSVLSLQPPPPLPLLPTGAPVESCSTKRPEQSFAGAGALGLPGIGRHISQRLLQG